MKKVFAVVLTYNRQALLDECLRAVKSQTRPCDDIIVINNASTDGTEDFLKENWKGKVSVYSLSRNIGAAGGFSAGLRIAFNAGADFIWVMDDDLFPEPDALEHLMKADALLDDLDIARAYLVSSPRTPDGEVTNVPSIHPRRNKDGYEAWPELLEYGLMPVNRAAFTSILLPRACLAEHGLPIREMYIWGEDTEYTMRVTKKHSGYVVGSSKVRHTRSIAGRARIETETDMTRIKYHKRLIRNEIYISKHHFFLPVTLARHALTALKLLFTGRPYKALIVVQGSFSGFFFNPQIEPATTPLEQLDTAVRSFR